MAASITSTRKTYVCHSKTNNTPKIDATLKHTQTRTPKICSVRLPLRPWVKKRQQKLERTMTAYFF